MKMKSFWITQVLFGLIITMRGFCMPFVPAAEVEYVQVGSTVTVNCNISYLYDTTWLKHNPDATPTVVLSASLREGQPVQVFQLNHRFSVSLMNRSLALMITDVEEDDLGLYYCIANVNTQLIVGTGTMLQVSSSGFSWFLIRHWYCITVGLGLLMMVLAVCVTHWKAKSNQETASKTTAATTTQSNKITSNIRTT